MMLVVVVVVSRWLWLKGQDERSGDLKRRFSGKYRQCWLNRIELKSKCWYALERKKNTATLLRTKRGPGRRETERNAGRTSADRGLADWEEGRKTHDGPNDESREIATIILAVETIASADPTRTYAAYITSGRCICNHTHPAADTSPRAVAHYLPAYPVQCFDGAAQGYVRAVRAG
jgi:hypothetical protein